MRTNEMPILFARDGDGVLRHVDAVPNGDACGCVCPACGQPMRARNAGQVRRHSFAHRPGATCAWAVEAVISSLAWEAVEAVREVALPALSYHNAVTGEEEPLSPARVMRVERAEVASASGRQAPHIVVTVRGGKDTARFAVCVTLRKKPGPEQVAEMSEGTRGVVLVDLGLDLARRKRQLGKHFDRDELVEGYQSRGYLLRVLTDPASGLASWAANARRDALEAESEAELARREGEREERRLEEERAREQARREKAAAAERERAEQEKLEEREGVVREPDRYVTRVDEYDVRRWRERPVPTGSLPSGESLRRNGAINALIKNEGGRSVLWLQTDMSLDAVNEVSWKYGELTRGFDEAYLLFGIGKLEVNGLVELTSGGEGAGSARFTAAAWEYCCALQGLVRQGAGVRLNDRARASWDVESVDVAGGIVRLHRV